MEFNDRRLAAAKDLAHREALEALSKKNFPNDTRKKKKLTLVMQRWIVQQNATMS